MSPNASLPHGGGVTDLKIGYGYVPLLRPPFQTLLSITQDLHFRTFSSSRPYICLKSQIFEKNYISKPQSWGKDLFLSLKFGQISVPRASNWTKKLLNLAAVCSLSPYFQPLRPHTHNKMNIEYPTQIPSSKRSTKLPVC